MAKYMHPSTTWSYTVNEMKSRNGEVISYEKRTIYIEHEVTAERHRLIVDGTEGPWVRASRVAKMGDFYAATIELPELPEVFTVNSQCVWREC